MLSFCSFLFLLLCLGVEGLADEFLDEGALSLDPPGSPSEARFPSSATSTALLAQILFAAEGSWDLAMHARAVPRDCSMAATSVLWQGAVTGAGCMRVGQGKS